MTSNEQSLEGLIERVTAAQGPDRELDRSIGRAFGVTETTFPQYEPGDVMPSYTASIDAALALVERYLPGWSWSIGHDANGELHATIWHGVTEHDEYGATPALAILAALLTALKDASE